MALRNNLWVNLSWGSAPNPRIYRISINPGNYTGGSRYNCLKQNPDYQNPVLIPETVLGSLPSVAPAQAKSNDNMLLKCMQF